jgi:competence protein ComEC
MPFLAFAFALAAGGILPWAPALVVATASAFVVLAKRRRGWLAAIVGVGLLVGALRARATVTAAGAARARADRDFPRIGLCAGEATVVRSPVARGGGLQWTAEASHVDCGQGEDAAGRIALFGGPPDLARGDRVSFIADLAAPERFAADELGASDVATARRGVVRTGSAKDVRRLARGRGPPAWIDRARAHVRARIDATYGAEVAPMARALVLGESDLEPSDDAAFRASGLSHLLAVSGMHLVLVVVGVVKVVRAFLARTPLARGYDVGRFAALIGLPLTWFYADFAGGSGSAVRAAWMLTVQLGLRALARRVDPWRALALSVAAFVLVDPLGAFDVSFVLSAAATFGLLAFGDRIGTWLEARVARVPKGILRSLAATAAATITCAPLIARMSGTVAIVGLAANLVAVPVGEAAALPLCLGHALLAPWPAAESGAATTASGALAVTRAIARGAAKVPALPVPPPTDGQLAVLVVVIGGVASRRLRAPGLLACAAALVLFELRAIGHGRPEGRLRATFLDVGQGDAALVDLPDGSALLIDGGGIVGSPVDVGERVVAPVLRARRRGELRAVVLSHPHPDHFGGLPAALRGVQAAELWDTGQGEREGVGGGYATLLSQFGTWRTRRPDTLCGEHALGGAAVQVLAPCPGPLVERGPNDNSFVLRIRLGRRSILFLGDAEHEEEAELVARHGAALASDVIKVGHHGSRTSSTAALLDAVHPSLAVVSCGVRNRFGHPHPSTLAAFDERGIRTLRTDHDGTVVVETDGEQLEVGTAVR